MTQEEKEFLLRDLCSRLPYGVKVYDTQNSVNVPYMNLCHVNGIINEVFISSGMICRTAPIEDIKPFLIPMSSMTEEQKEELLEITDAIKIDDIGLYYEEGDTLETYLSQIPYTFMCKVVTWCYKNHFDINGLIPMGLAIDATSKNIY